MSKEKIEFPKDFLWGASTSAYQIEGGIINDWSEWERSNKRVKELKRQDKDPEEYTCGRACDSYNRYKEDMDLVAGLNCGAYRMGVEWARIEPREGEFDDREIEHYKRVLEEAKKRNLKTVLTLWHWTNPVWVAEKGGWADKEVVNRFTRYASMAVKELEDKVDYWVTLNEPMVHVSNGYLSGKFPPNKKNIFQARRVFNNLVQAHNKTYKLIHQFYPGSRVSITKLTNDFQSARRWCPLETGLAKLFNHFWNERFLQRIKGHLDYIGVDYYFHDRIIWRPPFKKNKNEQVTDLGWEIYPKGIYNVLKYLSKYEKPLIVLENGLADADDKKRADFIKNHLYYVRKAMDEGADVRGYFYWSLLDNFEWAEGFWPKFGLYEVDRNTFERKPRESAKVYAEICKTGKIDMH
ncbi:MAG: glycoside hydrolase family 1 protein [Patescibacteria group bacterium]